MCWPFLQWLATGTWTIRVSFFVLLLSAALLSLVSDVYVLFFVFFVQGFLGSLVSTGNYSMIRRMHKQRAGPCVALRMHHGLFINWSLVSAHPGSHAQRDIRLPDVDHCLHCGVSVGGVAAQL